MAGETFPYSYTSPLYPFVNFQNPMSYYFLSLSFDPPHPTPTWPTPPLHDPPQHTPPHPFMAHPIPPHPMAGETFPYSYTSPYIHLWIFKTLWVIIFWVWVLTHPTPPLHDPPHPFMTHPIPSHPTPGTFLGTKEPFFMGCFTMSPSYDLLFSELESLIKCWMWIA